MSEFAGADWIKESYKAEMSALGIRVADLLGELVQGIYHLDSPSLQRVDWRDDYCIRVSVPDYRMATFDFDGLTRLVVLCHDRCLRCQLIGQGPRYLGLMFHERQREGSVTKRHPTIEQAIEQIRGKP